MFLNYTKSPELLLEDRVILKLETIKSDIKTFFFAEKNCSFIFISNLSHIVVNKIALEQILINLIANAIKYCDKKNVVIEIKESETQYEILVKDNGSGISKMDQKKIFQLFKTLSIKDKYGFVGNGIGLATVKKIVGQLGGEINIDSKKRRRFNI